LPIPRLVPESFRQPDSTAPSQTDFPIRRYRN
jgi:hypothetical protein